MEQKLNIAKILKNKPRGTKLYSMIHGKCSFEAVTDEIFKINFCTSKFGLTQSGECTLIKFGNMYDGGECIIFPSKEMRDWSKFAWKKGDVLKNTAYEERVIFDGFLNDDYTYFKGKHPLDCSNKFNITYHEECNCFTGNYRLESTNAAQTYISTIEGRLGGKLNRETFEIEKAQPKFKVGDTLFVKYNNRNIIFILSNINGKFYNHRVRLDSNKVIINYSDNHFQNEGIEFIRYATEEEKQKLLDALAKEGKAWDAENKQIVDLKPKVKLKPFDKVIVRCSKTDNWSIDFFSYKVSNGYICTGDAWFKYCLPYNEETAKLVGTTNNVES